MSSFPPSSPAVHPVLLRGSLHALCPAGLHSSKVEVLQEKSRSLVRTTSIMSGQRYILNLSNYVSPRADPLLCLVLCSQLMQPRLISLCLFCYEIPRTSDDLWGTLTLSFFLSSTHLPPSALSFLAVCLSAVWTVNVDGAGLTSVHCPDAWPGVVYHFFRGFYHTHTHTQSLH